jgi:hypothetical protein
LEARGNDQHGVRGIDHKVVSRRFLKKQQMQWTLSGAHLLLQMLQTRTKVLNNELEDVFRRWYPRFRDQAACQVGRRNVTFSRLQNRA